MTEEYPYLKPPPALVPWLRGILKLPWKKDDEEGEEEDKAADPVANLKAKKEALKNKK